MQGSLDDPPIVIKRSRWKLAVLLLLGVGATGVCGWMVMEAWPGDYYPLAIGVLGALFCFAAVISCLYEIIRPTHIVIGPAGLEDHRTWKVVKWAWSEIGDVGIAQVRNVRFVGIRLSDGAPDSVGRSINRRIADVDAYLSNYLSEPVAKVLDLIQQARERWG